MSERKPQRWVLVDSNGTLRGQISISGGRTPSEEGSNPEGFAEYRIARIGDQATERLEIDGDKARWVKDAKLRARSEAAHEHARGSREAYVLKVITTLFPERVITPAEMAALFPTIEDGDHG